MSDRSDSGQPPANRFTPDAERRMEQLRAMAEELEKLAGETEPKGLTPMEVRLARHTPVAALERAASFVEATPGMGGIDVDELRDTIAFELAYGGVRDAAHALTYRIDQAILRRKLKAVKTVRALYRMAKGYVTLDAGDAVRPHVEALKQTLVRPARRRKKGEETE